MTIEQIVDIPADRRLHLDFEVPLEIPAGKARLTVTPLAETPKIESAVPSGAAVPRNADEGASPHPNSDALLGILSGMGDIDLDDLRMERIMTRYLKHSK
jgi:hypothetical protein